MKNTGRRYEELTERVFARLLAQDAVVAKLERDVVLSGKSTKHQVDVTFAFVAGKTVYRTIVQCKDWSTPVKQEQVLAFYSVLTDVPGQPRGIMVSRSGYQQGARDVAEHHGIQLYELREPTEEDWRGLVRSVEITVVVATPEFRRTRFRWDDAWNHECLTRAGIREYSSNTTHPSEDVVVETANGEAYDLVRLLNRDVPNEEADWTEVTRDAEVPLRVGLPGLPVPRLQATGVLFERRVRKISETFTFTLDHLVAYCFRDVLAGSSTFLRHDGGPVKPGQVRFQ